VSVPPLPEIESAVLVPTYVSSPPPRTVVTIEIVPFALTRRRAGRRVPVGLGGSCA
jgi:hypothetical protein